MSCEMAFASAGVEGFVFLWSLVVKLSLYRAGWRWPRFAMAAGVAGGYGR